MYPFLQPPPPAPRITLSSAFLVSVSVPHMVNWCLTVFL